MIKRGFICEDLDLNKWVLLEADLILEEGVELEIFIQGKEWTESTWQNV